MAKPALGRGLGALLGGTPKPATATAGSDATGTPPAQVPAGERVERVTLNRIHPCPFQPRKHFSAEALRELADSIKEQGIVQPLIVRERNGHLELIAGERRWRAAQLLGLSLVPVIVRDADDAAVLELALIENLQRENLNPLEEAHGYSELLTRFQLTQEQIAVKVGKSRAAVANSLRLLKLPSPLRDALREGRLSVGHAKVLLGLPSEKEQQLAGSRILKQGLSVRQTEELVGRLQTTANGKTGSAHTSAVARDPHVLKLETKVRERLGTKVNLRYSQGKGVLEISFFSDDELDGVLEILGIRAD